MSTTTGARRFVPALLFTAALGALLVAAWLAYRPGLSGDFLFDDFGNLPAIGATGPIDHWATFWRYITSGTADPTGRPLTLLSFLIDARNWPAPPRPFKVTNVLLHLLNGALLTVVLLRLGRALNLSSMRMRAAALFGAGAWLLHPLFVSTTLYIVQREAMLPATFTLLGMIGWCAARESLAHGHLKRGLFGMALSAWGCTLLAVLSKANGALLPLLLLITEWIVLAPNQPMPVAILDRRRKQAVAVLLALPSVALVFWLLLHIPGQIRGAAGIRDWTMWQRLISEPRALTDYLALLWLPRAHSLGIFTDSFKAASDLLHPRSTLPCIALILMLIGLGFAVRKRHPALALALLFYFGGHLLESSWLPLELYYEHRNYLPAMLMFWPLGIGLSASDAWRWLGGAVALAILIFLCGLTAQRATLWSNGYRQAMVWAAFDPASPRAQANAAQYEMARGRPRLAAARLRNALPAHPDDLQIPVNLIGAECRLQGLRPQSLQAVRRSLETNKVGGTLGFNWFNSIIEMAKNQTCPGLDFSVIQSLLASAHTNPYWRKVPGRQQDLAHLQGMLDLAEGHARRALQDFNNALALEPRPDTALEQAAILASHGWPQLGLAHLDYWNSLPLKKTPPQYGMPRLHAWVLAREHYWQHEEEHLRARMASDATGKQKPPLQTQTKSS